MFQHLCNWMLLCIFKHHAELKSSLTHIRGKRKWNAVGIRSKKRSWPLFGSVSWCLGNYCNYQGTNLCDPCFVFYVSVFSAHLFFGSKIPYLSWVHASYLLHSPSRFSPPKGHSPHLTSIFLLWTSNLTEGSLLLLQQPTSRTWCASGSNSIPMSPWKSRRSSPGKHKTNTEESPLLQR